MIERRRCRSRGVSVGCNVVQPNDEAIINVPGAHGVLIELMSFRIPSQTTGQHPVRCELDRTGGEDAFAAGQVAKLRLRRIIAVEQADRPAIVVGARFGLEALTFQVCSSKRERTLKV